MIFVLCSKYIQGKSGKIEEALIFRLKKKSDTWLTRKCLEIRGFAGLSLLLRLSNEERYKGTLELSYNGATAVA